MTGILIFRVVYYMAAVAFHVVLFFTNVGNYFHGGTPVELIAMEGVAVVIFMAAIKLFLKAKMPEKIVVVLCALLPSFFVIASLVSGLSA